MGWRTHAYFGENDRLPCGIRLEHLEGWGVERGVPFR
jgi:hypothetical protein